MDTENLNQVGDVIECDKLGYGEWVVDEAKMTGAGYGHGANDYYPPGHQITLLRLVIGTNDINPIYKPQVFYQCQWFSPTLNYQTPIRTLKKIMTVKYE